MEYAEKALEIYRELFGERHPFTATTLSNIGIVYGKLGNYERNLEYIEKALKLRRETLGDKHPYTILSVHNLVSLLINLERRPQAFDLLEAFIGQLSKDHIYYDMLKKLEHALLSKPVRKGFRQPSCKTQGRKQKRKKNKGR